MPEQAVVTGREEHCYCEQLRLEVEDTGPGIAPEYLERIFEPFFSTKPETGVGLDLGVVRKLILLYGGTVEVRSAVGQGTRFVLTLPRSGARSNG
ncbi:ATP-binding protein [Archangium sp.]|uniref:ATP-binding protein n=1 Tax=Archangium sp. TaxID=1872627 RepID=UPI00286C3160|nr:ATP-binding protein [Archangium sp.]